MELQKTASQGTEPQEVVLQDMDLQEADPQGIESQEAASPDMGLQEAVLQDMGLQEAVPEVIEVFKSIFINIKGNLWKIFRKHLENTISFQLLLLV